MVKTVEERYAILLRNLNLSIQMFVPLKLIKTKSIKFYQPTYIKLMLLKEKKLWRIMKAKNTFLKKNLILLKIGKHVKSTKGISCKQNKSYM